MLARFCLSSRCPLVAQLKIETNDLDGIVVPSADNVLMKVDSTVACARPHCGCLAASTDLACHIVLLNGRRAVSSGM